MLAALSSEASVEATKESSLRLLGQDREGVVCLFSDGAEDYELLCRVMVRFLEEKLGDAYVWMVTKDPGVGQAPDGALFNLDQSSQPAAGEREVGLDRASLSGSMDILDAIGKADPTEKKVYYFGFAQSDVSYYFRHGGHSLYATPHHRRREVVSLARVYREVLHIYSEGLSEAALADFGKQLPAWEELYLGALGSGTLITSLNLLSVYGAGGTAIPDALRPIQESPSRRWRESLREPSWGGMLVAGIGDPEVSAKLSSGAGRLVSLGAAQRRHLENAFSEFYTTTELNAYGQRELAFLEVPALLVASKRLPASVASALIELMNQVDRLSEGDRERFEELLPASLDGISPERFRELEREVFKGMVHYRGSRTQDLILSPHRATLDLRTDPGHWELLVLGLAALIGFLVCRRALRDLREKKSILEVSPVLTGAGALALSIAWIHACLLVVRFLEHGHYMSYGTDTASPFIRHNYFELLPMVMQYIASVFSSEKLFPLDQVAQVFWLSVPVLMGLTAVSGLFHLALPPVLDYLRNNLEKGSEMNLDGHYIIVSWHRHAQDVVGQLRIQERMAETRDPVVVVLSREESDITLPRLGHRKSETLGEYTLFGLPPEDSSEDSGILTVAGIFGDLEELSTLRMARPDKAKAVIVFPDPSHAEPDSATVLTILRLQEILGEESKARILVWCADPRSVNLFQDPRFRLTDACSTEWAWRVLCQATRVGHVSTIYRHLLTSSVDSNEFYEYRVPETWEGGTFADVQEIVSRYNTEMCGLIPGAKGKKNTLMLVGYFEASDSKRERVHINPSLDSEVLPGDALIFLTYVYDSKVAEDLGQCFSVDASSGSIA